MSVGFIIALLLYCIQPNDDEWVCTTGGVPVSDPCTTSYTGVTCSTNVMIRLDLSNIGLAGSIPT